MSYTLDQWGRQPEKKNQRMVSSKLGMLPIDHHSATTMLILKLDSFPLSLFHIAYYKQQTSLLKFKDIFILLAS
jgi:hypothetical protein